MAEASLLDAKSFSAFSNILDVRILRSLADMGFARPTLVQAKAIPLALEGRDILARARTGSGKTAAYCIPILQKILAVKSINNVDKSAHATRALILVPTRELSEQVFVHVQGLLTYCDKEIHAVNVASGVSANLQQVLLTNKPDILISTPARVLSLARTNTVDLTTVESLVVDEADLVFSYGHDDDVRQLFAGGILPKDFQSFLMSATMTNDVEQLKGLVLRNPVILKLEEDEDEAAFLSQYAVRCSEVDKFLLTYVILKLKLIKGKCILFVNDVDRCYRVKLFLEQFSIKSCVLNSELPLNSRVHIVQEFNKGVYDYIIATDEASGSAEQDSEDEVDTTEESATHEVDHEEFIPTQRNTSEAQQNKDVQPASSHKGKRKASSPHPESSKPSRKRKQRKINRDNEYGVVRGVDFIDVSCVLNFDLPSSSRAYTHRVGRTARAGRTGMSLSFVVPEEEWGKNKIVGGLESAKHDGKVFARIEKDQAARGSKIKDYKFDMKQVEAFRYRMDDALRAVTRHAVKEARLKELKSEMLNSDKLKAHFEDNPLDLEYLRHDKPLHPTRVQAHMKHVPKYLLPRIASVQAQAADATEQNETSFVPFKKTSARQRGRGRGGRSGTSRGKKKSDPLRTFRH